MLDALSRLQILHLTSLGLSHLDEKEINIEVYDVYLELSSSQSR